MRKLKRKRYNSAYYDLFLVWLRTLNVQINNKYK